MFPATLAGSLPKFDWLAEPNTPGRAGADGSRAPPGQVDATLLWLKIQEDAGLEVVGDGEQSRQHFVHGFSNGSRASTSSTR